MCSLWTPRQRFSSGSAKGLHLERRGMPCNMHMWDILLCSLQNMCVCVCVCVCVVHMNIPQRWSDHPYMTRDTWFVFSSAAHLTLVICLSATCVRESSFWWQHYANPGIFYNLTVSFKNYPLHILMSHVSICCLLSKNVLMSWIVFPTCLDVLNCFSNLSWCPQLTPWYKHPGWQGVKKIGSSSTACEEWPFTTVFFLRMIFSSRLSQCLDVPDLPDEDWPSSAVHFLRMILWFFNSRLFCCLDVPDLPDEDWPPSVVRFLRMILWSLTAGFLDVLMFQTYLIRIDHPLLFISSEWSHDL